MITEIDLLTKLAQLAKTTQIENEPKLKGTFVGIVNGNEEYDTARNDVSPYIARDWCLLTFNGKTSKQSQVTIIPIVKAVNSDYNCIKTKKQILWSNSTEFKVWKIEPEFLREIKDFLRVSELSELKSK